MHFDYTQYKQKGFAPILILVGILILTAVGGAYYFFKVKTPEQRACTLEAKICPDGSSVGRSGPNCEFSPCPQISPSPILDETVYTEETRSANWKIFEGRSSYYLDDSNKGKFVLYYPENCELERLYHPILKCLGDGFSIYPEAGGRGAEIINQTGVKLGNYSWIKRIFKVGTGLMAATYDLFINDTQQVIEVHYDKYSPEIEKEAEKIIATFKAL